MMSPALVDLTRLNGKDTPSVTFFYTAQESHKKKQ